MLAKMTDASVFAVHGRWFDRPILTVQLDGFLFVLQHLGKRERRPYGQVRQHEDCE